MSKNEIIKCYKRLLESIGENTEALVWATNLQSAWIKFIGDFLKETQELKEK